MFSDYRKAHISELLKSNFSIVWAFLVLVPCLWLLIALQLISSFKIWWSFQFFFQNTGWDRALNAAFQVWYYTSMHLLGSGVLDHYLCLSSADCFLCIFILFSWVFLWVLSHTSIGPEFSNQNVTYAHLVIMLCSPGIKCNAAFRAVASTEEKWANTNPAACLFCTEVMLPDGYPEEALWERWCAGPDRRNKLFLETEEYSDKCRIMEHIFVRAMDRDGQDHRGLVGSHYKLVLHRRTCWDESPTILEEHCL